MTEKYTMQEEDEVSKLKTELELISMLIYRQEYEINSIADYYKQQQLKNIRKGLQYQALFYLEALHNIENYPQII